MKVKEVLEQLKQFNQEADMAVIAHNKAEQFTITYGGPTDGEGTPKAKTGRVSFYVDSLCQSEK